MKGLYIKMKLKEIFYPTPLNGLPFAIVEKLTAENIAPLVQASLKFPEYLHLYACAIY